MPYKDPEAQKACNRRRRERIRRDPVLLEEDRRKAREYYRKRVSTEDGRIAILEKATRWRRNNPEKMKEVVRRHNLKRWYGITEDDVRGMLAEQDGKCAICGQEPKKKRLGIDHDHKTGQIRSLLCSKCNVGLGHFDHDLGLMHAAIRYLEKHADVRKVVGL